MNEPRTSSLQDAIDRLVDGELNHSQQQQLLLRLDAEPGAWRRCALAFVESRVWAKTFRDVVRSHESIGKTSPSTDPRRASGASHKFWLALAASFLVAWISATGLLWLTGTRRPGRSEESVVPRADPSQPVLPAPTTTEDPARRPGATPPHRETVHLVIHDGPASLDVPIVTDLDGGDTHWPASDPPVVPDHVRQALRRLGHEVQEVRRLFPVRSDDGRQFLVPVHDVHVQFVGDRTYQ